MFNSDYDDDDLDGSEEIRKEIVRRSAEEFIEGCYEAYDLLATNGQQALREAEASSIQRAINRMTSLFIMKEEYERCQFLKKFVDENMPGFQITPDRDIEKELNNINL